MTTHCGLPRPAAYGSRILHFTGYIRSERIQCRSSTSQIAPTSESLPMRATTAIAAMTATVSVLACAVGCMPWTSAGYEPHGDGRKFGPGGCNPNYLTWMRFKLDGGARLDTEATFAKDSSPTNYLGVSLALKSHQSARFEKRQGVDPHGFHAGANADCYSGHASGLH